MGKPVVWTPSAIIEYRIKCRPTSAMLDKEAKKIILAALDEIERLQTLYVTNEKLPGYMEPLL